MYHILAVNIDSTSKTFILNHRQKISRYATFTYATDVDEANELLKKNLFQMILLDISEHSKESLALVRYIRRTPQYFNTPIIILSDTIDHLLYCFLHLHCYDYLTKPLLMKQFLSIIYTINFAVTASDSEHEDNTLSFNTRHDSYRIRISDINFLEHIKQRSVIHTKSETISVRLSLAKLLELCEGTPLIQAHRSVIINPRNVSFIRKTTHYWLINFHNSDEVTKGGKKYLNDLKEILQTEDNIL